MVNEKRFCYLPFTINHLPLEVMSKTQPARGMRDFLPPDVRKRDYVVGIIREVYESYGFEPLETPAVENLETLVGKYGEEGNQLIYKILKRGEKLDLNDKELSDLALRYDLTVPLARVVAQYRNDLPRFFKRYQIQPVWRADRPARGRFREFYQCDVDAIGSSSMIVEAELCSAVSEILQRLGINTFEIRLNHRKLLSAILEVSGIPVNLHTDTLITLDKLDKIGGSAVAEEMFERGIPLEGIEKAMAFMRSILEISKLSPQEKENLGTLQTKFPSAKSDEEAQSIINSTNSIIDKNEKILERISGFVFGNENGETAIKEIKEILSFVNNLIRFRRVKINPLLARGLSYYTGAIFEINVPDLAGSLGGGGRYDNLIGMFGKVQIPACGFSLGLERILVVMEERGMFQKLIDEGKLNLNSVDVLLACFDESLIADCLKLAEELRRQNLRVCVYPEAKQSGKPYKYAEQIDVPFVCLLRENELAENKVSLKNMRTGEQETVAREDVSGKIKV